MSDGKTSKALQEALREKYSFPAADDYAMNRCGKCGVQLDYEGAGSACEDCQTSDLRAELAEWERRALAAEAALASRTPAPAPALSVPACACHVCQRAHEAAKAAMQRQGSR